MSAFRPSYILNRSSSLSGNNVSPLSQQLQQPDMSDEPKIRKLVIVVKTPRQKMKIEATHYKEVKRGKKYWKTPINKPHWLSTWDFFRSRIDSIQINSHWVRFYWIVKRKQQPLIFAGLYLFMISRSISHCWCWVSNLQSHFI